MNNIYLIAGLLLVVFLNGCASSPELNATFQMTADQYAEAIQPYSDHFQEYDGPTNLMDVSATLLNSHVIEAQMLRQASVFKWDKSKYQTELKLKREGLQNKTEIFVSFYTPERKSADLLRSNTLWKSILKTKEKEIEGQAKKINLLPVEVQSLYPSFNRWSSGYILTFNIPPSQIENTNSELIITGPIGTARLKFQGIKASSQTTLTEN